MFEHLQVIQAPEARARLEGVNEVALLIEGDAEKLKETRIEKRGMVAAARATVMRVTTEMGVFQKRIDEGKLDPEHAKLQLAAVQQVLGVLREIEQGYSRDLTVLDGRIEGLFQAHKASQAHFDGLVAKYERHQREELEDVLEVEEPAPNQTMHLKAKVSGKTVTQAAAAVAKGKAKKKAPARKKAKRAKDT